MKVRCSFVLGGLIYETMLDRLTREQRTFIPIYDWWAVPTLPQRLVGRAQPTLVGRAHPTALEVVSVCACLRAEGRTDAPPKVSRTLAYESHLANASGRHIKPSGTPHARGFSYQRSGRDSSMSRQRCRVTGGLRLNLG
jgi:hypothetical protein